MPTDQELKDLRNRIRSWAQHFVCDGITPTKTPEKCGEPNGGSGVGDSILFSAILYYSGELWARANIIESKDEQGGMWRSPQRRRTQSDGSWGNSRFSQDHMLGVLLWLVTEYKRDPDSARSFANHWGSWMENHLSQNEFSLCRWDWTDAGAIDSCALEGAILGSRAAIIRRVFDYIGANSPTRRERTGGIFPTWRTYRLGDGRDAHDYIGYLAAACALAPDRGKKFNCHLLSIAALIFQEMGDDQRIVLDEGFRANPFAMWVNNGRQPNDEIRQLAYVRCLEATLSHEAETNAHDQWMWERSDFERDDRGRRVSHNSFGWDCIAMINLLNP
jgi:hypothetical protein